MRRLAWGHTARLELFAIADYYEQFGADLPARMLARIEEAPLILLDYPDLGSPTTRAGVRKWPAKGTPFLLLYSVRGDTVQVLRVLHAHSDRH